MTIPENVTLPEFARRLAHKHFDNICAVIYDGEHRPSAFVQLKNEFLLLLVEMKTLGSQLLDVQQDCIKLQKEIDALRKLNNIPI